MKLAHLPAASASPNSGQGTKLEPRDFAKQRELRQKCGASGPAASRQRASRAKGAKSDWPELSSVTASDKASNERVVPARRGSRPGPSGSEAPVCVATGCSWLLVLNDDDDMPHTCNYCKRLTDEE